MKTILHVSGAKSWRGGEQQIAYLIEELGSLEHHLLCPEGAPLAERVPPRASIQHFANRWQGVWRLYQYSRRVKPEVIHLHDPHAQLMGVLAASLSGLKIPMVLSRRVFFTPKNNGLTRWKYNHGAIRYILCVSEAVRQLHIPYLREPERLLVVPSGIDPSRFQLQDGNDRLRKELGIPPKVPLVGTVGALSAEKDHLSFLKVALKLVSEGSQAYFVLFGEGKEREKLQEFVEGHRLEQRVFFAGFRQDIPQVLPALSVFLFTSRKEGLGTSVLDAFAARVPVVATDAGGIPEMVRHRETGWLAPVGAVRELAEGVSFLLENPVVAAGYTESAWQLLERRFTKQAMGRAMGEVYGMFTDKR